MLSPPHPVAQCLARAADLLGNRVDRRPLRSVLGLVVQDHPNRASTDLRGIWGNSLRHGSILSRVGASGKPGTVHFDRDGDRLSEKDLSILGLSAQPRGEIA